MTTAPEAPASTRPEGGGNGRPTRWDVAFLVSALVILAGSLVPLTTTRWGMNVWGVYGMFFIGIGVILPLVAAGLLLTRAVAGSDAPGAGPRLGSLSAEQTAHVAAWLALAFFLITFATTLDPLLLIGLVGALGLVATAPLRGLVAPLLEGATQRPATPGATATHPGTTPAPAPSASSAAEPFAGSVDGDQAAAQRAAQRGAQQAGAHPAEAQPFDSRQPDAQATDPGDAGTGTDASADRRGMAEAPAGVGTGDHAPDETGLQEATDYPADAETVVRTGATGPSGTVGRSEPTVLTYEDEADEAEAGEADVEDPGAHEAGVADAADAADAAWDNAEQPSPRGSEEVEYEAFWFAVGSRRPAVDAEDTPLFDLEPGGWILALEDRGTEFLVQNTDGRTGLLRDLTDIERA